MTFILPTIVAIAIFFLMRKVLREAAEEKLVKGFSKAQYDAYIRLRTEWQVITKSVPPPMMQRQIATTLRTMPDVLAARIASGEASITLLEWWLDVYTYKFRPGLNPDQILGEVLAEKGIRLEEVRQWSRS